MTTISPLVAKGDFYYAEYNGGLRKQSIKHIVLHHWAGEVREKDSDRWAKWLSETSGTRFVNANYALGTNAKLYCILPEEYRPWTTGGSNPDDKAITVEIMNSTGAPTWEINQKQMDKLIQFVADVAKRYGWSRVTYTGGTNGVDAVRGKEGILLMHKWYGSTSCPGPYLSKKFDYIATEATKLLQQTTTATKPVAVPVPVKLDTIHRVQIGAFRDRKGAEVWETKAKEKGFNVWINPGADAWYRVQLGAFRTYKDAQQLEAKIKALGWDVTINSTPATQQKSLTEISSEVLAGKWGNDPERKKRLEEAGYNYSAVQGRVNEILSGQRKPYASKTIDELAREVLAGKWGNGDDRKRSLEAQGYSYEAVQRRVNEMLVGR